jgi:hypothetical protein
MPMPSKFTAENRKTVLEALEVGASRTTAAHLARLDEGTVRKWIQRGKESEDGSRYREFYEQVLAAEASPRVRALGVIYREMPDKPDLAWKFIERREPGFAPPQPNVAPAVAGPVVIQLALHDGRVFEPSTVIEGEVVEIVPNISALPAPSEQA